MLVSMTQQNYISTTTHDFKTNFSEYVRLLEECEGTSIIVYKYNKPIGLFTPFEKDFSADSMEGK